MDIKNMIDHLKSHQSYPATKDELVEECNELSDFSEADKKWFKETLPEGKYDSPDKVVEALGVSDIKMGAMA